jgi:beta-lactamase regulating signal transducer with metallopeptidase domain
MIADILFEVAWKSMIVAACVVALLMVMARQAPSNRIAVGGLGFAALLLLPATVAALAAFPLPAFQLTAPAPAAAVPMALLADLPTMVAPPQPETVEPQYSLAQLAVALWLAGVLAMVGRLCAGLFTLRQWARSGSLVEYPAFNRLLVGSRLPAATRVLVSDDISAPLSFGWRRPVIMLDGPTLADLHHAEAVVAHEAAHISRGDWPRLIAAKLVVALFWFNPFVWLLERLYLQDVEEAADAEATRLVEPARYAQALLNVARHSSAPLGANSIASGTLAKRIRKVLSGRYGSSWDRAWRAGALAGVTMVAAPIAIVQVVSPSVSSAAPAVLPAVAPVAELSVPSAAPAPLAVSAPAKPAAVARHAAALAVAAPIAPVSAAFAQTAAAPPVAPVAPTIDREEMERIRIAADEMRAQSQVIARDAKKIAERARAEAAVALAGARKEMLRGADEMDRGAIEMQRGAAQMREEARKLRDPAYRAKVIAEARENKGNWGGMKWNNKVPTDQELIDAIPKMEDGARRMDEGVEQMRRGAARMRESSRRN